MGEEEGEEEGEVVGEEEERGEGADGLVLVPRETGRSIMNSLSLSHLCDLAI